MRILSLIIISFSFCNCKKNSVFTGSSNFQTGFISIGSKGQSFTLRVDDNNCYLQIPPQVTCSKEKVNHWLAELHEINFDKQQNSKGMDLSQASNGFLDIQIDDQRFYYIIARGKEHCHLRLKHQMDGEIVNKAGYVPIQICEKFFPEGNIFRDQRLIKLNTVDRIFYSYGNTKNELSKKQSQDLINLLKKGTFAGFVYNGLVDVGIQSKYNLAAERNNNLYGELVLENKESQQALQFGRLKEGSSEVYIWTKGEDNVKKFNIITWPQILSLLKPIEVAN